MSAAAIETEGLTCVYRTGFQRREVRAVDGISLTVQQGTVFGLLGPNGAGKTTFVKLLLSIVKPTAGVARIFGVDCRSPQARRVVGYLPENHRLPPYLTGLGLLELAGALSGMPAGERRRRAVELLELVGLGDWGEVRLKRYSKGMLQRLGLAQALMHSPALVLLDEPTDGVDPLGRRQIRQVLRELQRRGVTVFLNSHLLAEVELSCDEVAILDHGRVALAGKVRELLAGKVYRVSALEVPEALYEELRRVAVTAALRNGAAEFGFRNLEELNQALDRLRGARCLVETVSSSAGTLEEVFLRTVQGGSAAEADGV